MHVFNEKRMLVVGWLPKIWICLIFLGPSFLFAQPETQRSGPTTMQPPIDINLDLVQAAGIRKISGKHIDLYTDIRDRQDIDELVLVFDAAVPQWCEYFGVEPKAVERFRISSIVLAQTSKQRFRDVGLFPADLPDFPAGFNRGHEFWVFTQPGEYYTRHLFLHEGTHAFMQWMLGGSGPPWFSEGMAELLAVHQWSEGELEIGLKNSTREGTPYWGRPKIVREDVTSGLGRTLDEVMSIHPSAFRDVRNYGWAWAACRFLSLHPSSANQFSEMFPLSEDRSPRFNLTLDRKIAAIRKQLEIEWQLYINEMEYGYDILASVIGPAAPDGEGQYWIEAGRGWQRTAIEIKRGEVVHITARGQIQIRTEEEGPWISEPGGITIEYHRGRPVGQLLIGVFGTSEAAIQSLSIPDAIGLGGDYVATADGLLSFRINESPAELNDNQSRYHVTIEPGK